MISDNYATKPKLLIKCLLLPNFKRKALKIIHIQPIFRPVSFFGTLSVVCDWDATLTI